MIVKTNYEVVIILIQEFNDTELKTWIFNYARILRKYNVSDISVVSRGKHKLAYCIDGKVRGNYIQLNLSSVSKYINILVNKLKFDSKVLRFLLIKKERN